MRIRPALVILAMCFPMAASAQGRVDVFAGYSLISSNVPFFEGNGTVTVGASARTTLNGWDASASLKMAPFLRAVADIGAGYGSLPLTVNRAGIFSITTNLRTYLFGPRGAISARKTTFFAHALFGLAHQNIGPDALLSNVGTRDNAFALALGGGIDFPLVSRLAFRVGADYLRATLFHATQQDPRLVIGLVVKF